MSNGRSTVAEKQVPAAQENPIVKISYDPEKALATLGRSALEMIGKLQGVKSIANVNALEKASQLLGDAEITLEEMTAFRDTLATRVKDAFTPFTSIPGLEGSSINITLSIPAKQRLETGIRALKTMRAGYLDEQRREVERKQLEAQAEQDRKNREAAEKAAKEAKKQGADKQTVAAIKEEVLSTPAPVVVSKAADVAQSVGASVRYSYSAQITDLKKFLGLCLNNPTMFATLGAAIPDIEKAFRTMAASQKESFDYPGIRFKRTAVDVGRRSA
jgi:hypothetical protein